MSREPRPWEDYKLWSHPKTHAKVCEIISRLPRGRLLDIASGEGALSAAASGMGFEVTACDQAPENFKAPGIECVRCDLDEKLPFPDESFECGVCIEAIEHLRDRYAFLSECARVLAPGSKLVVTTPNILNLESRRRFFTSGFFPLFTRPANEFENDPAHTHINPVPYYYLRHALVQSGFKMVKVCTDRYRKSALALAWLYPAVVLGARHSIRKETDPRQRAVNREIVRTMCSAPVLFGRTLIVVAERV